MKIPWLWIKNNILNKDISVDLFLERLNYLGLECEKAPLEKGKNLLINFLPASNRKDLNSWLGIANEISLISDFSNGLYSILKEKDELELEKEKIGLEDFSLIFLKNLKFKNEKDNIYLEISDFSDSEREENNLSSFFRLLKLQTSYNIEILCLKSFFEEKKYVPSFSHQSLNRTILLKISKENPKKSVSVLKEKDFFGFFLKQIKTFFKEPKIEVCFLSKNFLSDENNEKTIKLDRFYIEKRLGINLSKHNFLKILNKLKFKYLEKKKDYLIEIPFYRKDILEKHDLLEEIGKSFDYNKIPAVNSPSINKFENSFFEKKRLLKERIKSYFVSLGFYEVITYSLVNNEMLICEEKSIFRLLNPRSLNHQIYRQFIFPSHIEIFKNIFGKGFNSVSIFEISKVYAKEKNSQPVEKEKISLSLAIKSDFSTDEKIKENSFNFVKKLFENLFSKIGVERQIFWKEHDFSFLRKGLRIEIENEDIGFLGFLDNKFYRNKGFIEKDIISCEIELDRILEISIEEKKKKIFTSFLKSPIIKKDISFFILKTFNINEICSFIKMQLFKNDLFAFNVELIDTYESSSENNLHSLCFRLEFSAQKTDLENKGIREKIEILFASLEKRFKIVRR